MPKLIAVILTKNEAGHIAGCIAGLHNWVDAAIVWDSGSTDGTCEIARHAGAWVVQRPFDNYAAQRQAALDSLDTEWVLFVDADERATPALAEEIRLRLNAEDARPQPIAGFWIPRRNFIVGREIRGGGYFPDYQLRLLKRGSAHYRIERAVHEVVQLDGNAGYLGEPLLHFNYDTWPQFHRKQAQYARFEAQILAARGLRPRPHNLVLQPLREFRRRFLALQGWHDRLHGLQLAVFFAWYYGFVPYWLLYRSREGS
jgi:(heptosyl)LPS beta-1,4-glucosyltransferase